MNLARWTPVLGAVCLYFLVVRADEPRDPVAPRPNQAVPLSEFRGSGSCSATACHGRITRLNSTISKIGRNEHTTWISDDPHSLAYQTLLNERSQRIEDRLAADPARVKPASQDERCLACHTTPRPTSALAATSWINAEGVSCESCHGASSRWLALHTTIDWREKNRHEKDGLGLSDMTTLTRRAEVCAGCHVGGRSRGGLPTRDVNHDLIAAGHPRLNFELAAHLDNMQSHWDERAENAGPVGPTRRARDFPARAWAIGQLATERASLELLQHRATDLQAPWPEFAEYGCFSCHHDLRDEAWRHKPRADGSPVGRLRWGSWTQPLNGELIDQLVIDASVQQYVKMRQQINALMVETVPSQIIVASQARDTAGSLSRCLAMLASSRFGADRVKRLIEMLDSPGSWSRAASWEEAVRTYLALVALRQAWVELEPADKVGQEKLETRLEELRRMLDFPGGLGSPRGFDPSRLRP